MQKDLLDDSGWKTDIYEIEYAAVWKQHVYVQLL